jgi:hypothetical protein
MLKRLIQVTGVAVILTVLNASKPIHIDDGTYVRYGTEFAAHPLNPYGFTVAYVSANPAWTVLVPPVFPYYLAALIAAFGSQPVLLKLGLLPFALLFAWAVDIVAARVSPSYRVPVLWLTVLSPSVLPGFNLMVDVPMMALGLAALAMVVLSIERHSNSLILLSGLLAGLAIQTKYNGLIACGAVIAWCAFNGRPLRGWTITAIALAIAIAWEYWIARTIGESHFLFHFRVRQPHAVSRVVHLVLPLLSQVAGVAAVVALFAMTTLRWKRRTVQLAGFVMIGGLVTLVLTSSQTPLLTESSGKPILTISNLVYTAAAVIVWSVLAQLCVRLAMRNNSNAPERAITCFLLVWLGLELIGYFVFSPFPAARRVNGIVLVFTLLAARMAQLEGIRMPTAAKLAGCGITFALLLELTDWFDARAQEKAAHAIAERRPYLGENITFWYLGGWGFSYYAEHDGLHELRLNEIILRVGDVLAIPNGPELPDVLVTQSLIKLEPIETVVVRDKFPLRVTPGYYAGRTPIEHASDPRFRATIYRVVAATRSL